MRGFRRRFMLVLPAAALLACDRSGRAGESDSATQADTAAADSATAGGEEAEALAPVLAVHVEQPGGALLIPANEHGVALADSAPIVLISRDGRLSRTVVTSAGELENGCWGAMLGDPPASGSWTVGFFATDVQPIGADSLLALTRADSVSLANAVTRLASRLPSDTSGRFTGRPFSLEGLWRFQGPTGGLTLVATLKRQIDQEASPLQERTFILAERDAAGEWHTAHGERSMGPEETVESREFLGAAIVDGTEVVVLARDFGDGVAHTLLERTARGWRVRWTGTRRRC